MQAQTVATPRINSIGKKAIMAVTGVVWIGFVAAHMWGNLHLFQGQAAFNHYAEWLREVGEPIFSYAQLLWVFRIVLITSIVLHIWAALSLWRQADRARSTKYAVKRVVRANYATRFMRIGGVLIILFVLFHLAQFTWGWQPGFQREDPYRQRLLSGSRTRLSSSSTCWPSLRWVSICTMGSGACSRRWG